MKFYFPFLFFTTLFLLACSPSNKNASSNNIITTLRTACYSDGGVEEPACFELSGLEDINHNDYFYLDPNPENDFPQFLNPDYYQKPKRIIELSSYDPLIPITQNFVLDEFMSLNKGLFGLFSKFTASFIQKIRNQTGSPIHVTSAFRSPGYNARIAGAAKWSRHIYGDAVDFYSEAASLDDLKQFCLEKNASFYQIYQTHIHCDWRGHSLDENFYDPIQGKNNLVQIAKSYSKHSFISLSRGKERIFFEAIHPSPEDGGILVYRWTVETPSGEIYNFETPKINLPKEKGRYLIDLNLGGSVILNETFDI